MTYESNIAEIERECKMADPHYETMHPAEECAASRDTGEPWNDEPAEFLAAAELAGR